jgi:hypothetical protein
VKSILRRRPSPALVISIIALFVSLGGISYGFAAGSIDSREIKNNDVRTRDLRNNDIRTRDLRNNDIRTLDLRNNEVRGLDIRNSTVQGRDVALNTLTGDDIDEALLGKVPSATSADTATAATSAQNAATVGGMSVQKILAKVPAGTAGGPIFQNDYFLLAGTCGGGNADLILFGKSGVQANATAHSILANGTPRFLSSNNLATANLDLLGPQGTEGSSSITVSTTDGRVSTIVIGAQNAPAFQGENVCAFNGIITSG